MSVAPGLEAFRQAYEINPIALVGGLAQNMPGGKVSILSLTNPAYFQGGVTSQASAPTGGGSGGGRNQNFIDANGGGGGPGAAPSIAAPGIEEFFAHFVPIPGGTIIDQQVGMYPFANQAVAANAIITQPLKISLLMICPAREGVPYSTKLAIMQSLQQSLQKHNILGGTYDIATPAAFYSNCLMLQMADQSAGGSAQQQWQWRLDFIEPLLTLQQAQQTLNAAMSKINSKTITNGQTSGRDLTIGQPGTNAAPSVSPAASGSSAAGTGSFQSNISAGGSGGGGGGGGR